MIFFVLIELLDFFDEEKENKNFSYIFLTFLRFQEFLNLDFLI